MKKTILLSLAVITLSLVGCTGKTTETSTETMCETSTETIVETPAETVIK